MDENKPKKSLKQKALRFSGIAFETIGALTLIGWVQSRDPDCFLAETEDSLNLLRMCGSKIALVQTNVWWPLVASVIAIVLGLVLIRLSNKSSSK